MRKFFMAVAVSLLLTTTAFAEADNTDEGVPEITLSTAAAGIALLTGGSLLLSDKLRKRK